MSKTIPSQDLAIFVSLDVHHKPPVTVDPVTFPVEAGPMEIKWVAAKRSHVKDFRFPHDALELHDKPNGFSHARPRAQHSEFSVLDEFTAKGEFTYTLKVEHHGKTYTTGLGGGGEGGGDPVIHNR